MGNGTTFLHLDTISGRQLISACARLSMHSSVRIGLLLTSIFGLLLLLPGKKRPTIDVPVVLPRKNAPPDFGSMLIRGWEQNPGVPYKIVGPKSDLILLPMKYAAELGSYSSDKLSFGAAIHDFWVSKHTTWRYHLDDVTGRQTLMGSLKRDGANVVRVMDEEVNFAFSDWDEEVRPKQNQRPANRQEQSDEDTWTTMDLNPALRPLINRTFSRVLVDAPLCRDSEWLEAANGLGLKMMLAARDLRNVDPRLQPIVKHLLPSYRLLMAARRSLVNQIDPIVRKRLASAHHHKKETHDMIQYQINHSKDWRAVSVEFQSGQIFDNVFAGDNQIVNALLQCIYDLAAHPEFQVPMREEVQGVIKDSPSPDLTLQNLVKLQKIDSFMKEVVRLRPGTLVVMARKALDDVTLSDGLLIPRGVTVAMPSFAINNDAAIYGPDAAEFKPFRFVPEDPETPPDLKFESISGPGLDFGRGKAACPGRYIALWTMKVVLARFVQRYEVKLKPGAKRPDNIEAGVHKIANLKGEILIRRAV